MKLDLKDSWSVRIDVEERYQGTGRPYRRHINIIVYAPTIERALAIVRADYPDSTIWAINHANKDAVHARKRARERYKPYRRTTPQVTDTKGGSSG